MSVVFHREDRGYSILEALIACSLTMMVAAGITHGRISRSLHHANERPAHAE
jgi:type II secretory pathway component PulJ